MFLSMRQSNVYAFKRLSMKLQYEILSIGLKESMMAIAKDSNIGAKAN
jgi:predicted sulfurtransferase